MQYVENQEQVEKPESDRRVKVLKYALLMRAVFMRTLL